MENLNQTACYAKKAENIIDNALSCGFNWLFLFLMSIPEIKKSGFKSNENRDVCTLSSIFRAVLFWGSRLFNDQTMDVLIAMKV